MRPALSAPLVRLGVLSAGALLAAAACTADSSVILMGIPTITPNPVSAGSRFVINVGVTNAVGCDRATVSVQYNGVTVSTKQQAIGTQYKDSTFAVASGTVTATGTCGSAVQTSTELVTVN